MTAYVDRLESYGNKRWCHLIADSAAELHAIAQRCGLKREWFQDSPPASCPHYDAQPRIRALLIKAGAVECLTRSVFVEHVRRIRDIPAVVWEGRTA